MNIYDLKFKSLGMDFFSLLIYVEIVFFNRET